MIPLIAMFAMAPSVDTFAGTRRRAPKRPPPPAKVPQTAPAPAPTPAPRPGTWKTTIDVVLRAKPGEHADAVGKLAAGTPVTIEVEDGRWVRVRAGTQVGYLTRTTVVDTSATSPATDDGPRWSSERRDGSGLFVGVTAPSAPLFAQPAAGASAIAAAPRGARLAVLDATTPGWVKVRDDGGHEGWIARRDVDNTSEAAAVASTSEPVADAKPTAAATRLARGKLAITAGAAIGYRSLGMDFTSNGSAGLANYLVSADAAAADLGVDVALELARVRTGFDARVQLATSSPGGGIEYQGPSRASGDIPFKTFAFDAGVRAGVHARAFELAARAGFHHDAFLANDVANTARLPREQLLGATLGARVMIAPPRSRVDVGLRVDVLAFGSRDQTAGLEDGTSSHASAVWAGATIRIAVRRYLAVLSSYDFGRATTTWTGMSVRFADVTEARRVDSTQTVQLGIAAAL